MIRRVSRLLSPIIQNPEILAQILVMIFMAYWALFALLSPVTVWDAHVYNLGRLPVIEKIGLFGVHSGISRRQLMFPWSFDAVHWPAVLTGWGYALPSFLCFAATLVMLFLMVQSHAGKRVAWLVLLAFCSMPVFPLQAVSTKNDMPLLFLSVFVIFALWRHSIEKSRLWLIAMGIAFGFFPGIKSTGIIYGGLLGLGALWVCRKSLRDIILILASSFGSFLLLGSIEIYINNFLHFGSPFGSQSLMRALKNLDGIEGGIANFIRYFFGMFALVPGLPFSMSTSFAVDGGLAEGCSRLLDGLGLAEKGFAENSNVSLFTLNLLFIEESVNYGPIGSFFFLMATGIFLRFRIRSLAWKLAGISWFLLAILSTTIGWSPWKLRFFMIPVALMAVSTFLFLQKPLQKSKVFYLTLCLIFAFFGYLTLWQSENRKPANLLHSLTDRDAETFSARSRLLPLYKRVKEIQSEAPHAKWILLVNELSDTWVLPFLTMGLDIHPTGNVDALLASKEFLRAKEIHVLDMENTWKNKFPFSEKFQEGNIYSNVDRRLAFHSPQGYSDGWFEWGWSMQLRAPFRQRILISGTSITDMRAFQGTGDDGKTYVFKQIGISDWVRTYACDVDVAPGKGLQLLFSSPGDLKEEIVPGDSRHLMLHGVQIRISRPLSVCTGKVDENSHTLLGPFRASFEGVIRIVLPANKKFDLWGFYLVSPEGKKLRFSRTAKSEDGCTAYETSVVKITEGETFSLESSPSQNTPLSQKQLSGATIQQITK